ncbi:hypothetical protein O9A_00183 [Bartonella koehlerae C-29]|uniref:Uncharacterized protein n=1 Tax=Bartonella koehlerae C-29 TaxID=1134510 RepID=A0A067WGM4_9HYPH|nr:hypothetical protein O9A_00183 [Bartonella koehlerae C-29]
MVPTVRSSAMVYSRTNNVYDKATIAGYVRVCGRNLWSL